MIFNVPKMLYFNAIRVILCILTRGSFLWGRKREFGDSHPTHNSRHKKNYFFMIFIRKMLYFYAVGGFSVILIFFFVQMYPTQELIFFSISFIWTFRTSFRLELAHLKLKLQYPVLQSFRYCKPQVLVSEIRRILDAWVII